MNQCLGEVTRPVRCSARAKATLLGIRKFDESQKLKDEVVKKVKTRESLIL